MGVYMQPMSHDAYRRELSPEQWIEKTRGKAEIRSDVYEEPEDQWAVLRQEVEGEHKRRQNEHVRLRIVQNIHDKPGAFRQPGGDLSAFPEGHANERRIKGALLHPAGEHAGLILPLPGRDDEHAADDSAQGGLKLLGGIHGFHLSPS